MAEVNMKNLKRTMYILLFLGWALGNIDRYIMNYGVVYIGKDLTLTNTQTGLVLSAFFLGYAIMQIPGGMLADKYGAKRIILIAIIALSLFTGITAAAWSLVSLLVIRFLFGFFEAGFQPSAASIISTVFPRNERGKAVGVMLSAGSLMLMLVPIIAASLLVTIGWRYLFLIAALLGFIITYLYWRYIQLPKRPPTPAVSAGVKKQNSLMNVLKRKMIWTVIITFFGVYAVNWGIWTWIPTYLTNIRKLDIISIGWLQLIPGGAMFIAMLINGVIIDKLSLTMNKYVGAVACLFISFGIYFMFQSGSIAAFITFQSVVTICLSYLISLLPTMILKVVPTAISGTAVGVGNTSGQLAGFATPTLIGLMVDSFNGSYNAAAWMLAGFALLSMLALLITTTKGEEITEEEDDVAVQSV